MSDISTELIESVPDGVKCMFCRYDLRLLPINGRCPECGESIVKTFELAAARRNRPPWTIHGTIFMSLLVAQLVALVWQLMATPVRRWSVRLMRFDPTGAFLIVAICYVYLILRTRPRLRESRNRIILKYVFLAVLTFFLFVLTHLHWFDEPYMRLMRSLGWS